MFPSRGFQKPMLEKSLEIKGTFYKKKIKNSDLLAKFVKSSKASSFIDVIMHSMRSDIQVVDVCEGLV